MKWRTEKVCRADSNNHPIVSMIDLQFQMTDVKLTVMTWMTLVALHAALMYDDYLHTYDNNQLDRHNLHFDDVVVTMQNDDDDDDEMIMRRRRMVRMMMMMILVYRMMGRR